MDVALQVRKHLPRQPQPTLATIDGYCSNYQDLFKLFQVFKPIEEKDDR